MGAEEDWQRLQGLYAAMSDDELLRLAAAKGGLTEVAQQAVDAEMAKRRLAVEAEETPLAAEAGPELSDAQDDPSLVELTTFQIAMDAETALQALGEREIPVRMEPAMRRFVEGGPLVKTNWLTFYVQRARQAEAIGILRARMGLFPVLAVDEMDDSGDEDGDEEILSIVGNFEAADAELAQKALTEADVWFQAEQEEGVDGTMIEVRQEDWERAMEVVETAFEGN